MGFEPSVEHGCAIGVIADTHGYLDPTVLEIFAGLDLIVHCGDVGDPAILAALERLAPLVVVAGNLDQGDWAKDLPNEARGEVGGVSFVVGHKRKRLNKRWVAGKLALEDGSPPDLIISGHFHTPALSWTEQTLWLDPGSASAPYEEDEMPTVAVVECTRDGLSVRFIPLKRRVVE